MKKLALLTLAAFAIIACKKEDTGYLISGNLTGFNSTETVYINKISDSNRSTVIDSTTITNGKFNIKLPDVDTRDFNFITFSNTKGNILVIAENKKISITADKNDLRKAVITGSEENTIFANYLKNIGEQTLVENKINNESKAAAQAGDYTSLRSFKVKSDSLKSAKKQMRMAMINENPNSLVSAMAVSDLLNFKMIKASEAKALVAKMDTDLQQSRIGLNLKKALDNMVEETSTIGDKVADFSAPTPNGETLNLQKSLGKKITILDFWASWCRPCRMENPNVVKVYNKYKDQGLEIIGVSLDKSADKWNAAIEKDGLTWKHVSNLKSWQEPIAKNFGVRSIPATFILDENGIIIAKDLRGQALEEKIKELLAGS